MEKKIIVSLTLLVAFFNSVALGEHRTFFRCNQCPEAAKVTTLPAASGEQANEKKALDDPSIVHNAVTFKNGDAEIKGYLARPRREGRYPSVIILHGNPGATDDVRNTAAQLAQAGFVGLLVDWGSRAPMPESKKELAKWRDRITGYTFQKLVLDDIGVAVHYLKSQPFVQPGGIGMVGFCGGGKQALMFSARSNDVKVVVAFYASANFRQFRHKTDPVPELLNMVKEIRVPVQGHYGMLDKVALASDAKEFEAALRKQETPVEMFYYDKAGHSFYSFLRPPGMDPGFDYCPAEAELARGRMIGFLKKHLAP